MGYQLVLVKAPEVSTGDLWSSVQALLRKVEQLRTNALGALDRSVISRMVKTTAADNGLQHVGDPSQRKNFTAPPSGYLTEVQNKKDNTATFVFVPPKGSKITVRLEPDALGIGGQVCANCKQSIVGKNPALSHNVIPQQAWKQIIDSTLHEWKQHIASGTLVAKKVRSFSSLSKQESGKAVDAARFGLGDGKNANHTENKKVVDRLKADGLIMTAYAAQDNVGKQCKACEGLQANATLLQRSQLLQSGQLQSKIDDKTIDPSLFVGKQMTQQATDLQKADLAAGLKKSDDTDAMLRRITLAQVGRLLNAVEDLLADLAKTSTAPLLALLLDHWEEFVWTFRSVALTVCGAKYNGNLGISGLTLN